MEKQGYGLPGIPEANVKFPEKKRAKRGWWPAVKRWWAEVNEYLRRWIDGEADD